MENILNDESKFKKLGPTDSHDHTAHTEKNFRKYLTDLKTNGLLSEVIVKRIRPVGAQRARMYGLPKVHKKEVPLRPILSTIKTSARPVAEYLKDILQPIHEKYSSFCAYDSFTFATEIKSLKIPSTNFMCSYDIKSLFTNIPLSEVIKICADALYSDENTIPPFSKSIFIELLEFATCGVEFSFNHNMYQQLEGCGMGNVLSSLLSNIYVGYLEHKMFSSQKSHHPLFYKRYVDDTFALFSCKEDSMTFFNELNSLSSLEFTMEEESENQLPFLDVMIERKTEGFVTSVYRKPTFAGTYQKWNSFSPQTRKISLLEMIVHRAINICSVSTLSSELNKIKSIFKNSGYPSYIVEKTIKKKLAKCAKNVTFGPSKHPIYISLPYKGIVSERVAKNIRSSVHSTYGAVQLRVIFRTSPMLPNAYKDPLPRFTKSNIVYMFKCNRCESEYIGKTSRRLVDRINEHIPSVIRRKVCDPIRQNAQSEKIAPKYSLRSQTNTSVRPQRNTSSLSAIAVHLYENPTCASNYTKDCFKVIGQARSSFQLSVLEAMHINSNKPILCRQKDFVYHCKLFRNFISS